MYVYNAQQPHRLASPERSRSLLALPRALPSTPTDVAHHARDEYAAPLLRTRPIKECTRSRWAVKSRWVLEFKKSSGRAPAERTPSHETRYEFPTPQTFWAVSFDPQSTIRPRQPGKQEMQS